MLLAHLAHTRVILVVGRQMTLDATFVSEAVTQERELSVRIMCVMAMQQLGSSSVPIITVMNPAEAIMTVYSAVTNTLL